MVIAIKTKTDETTALFFKDVAGERPYDPWPAFDKGLAREPSLFIKACRPFEAIVQALKGERL